MNNRRAVNKIGSSKRSAHVFTRHRHPRTEAGEGLQWRSGCCTCCTVLLSIPAIYLLGHALGSMGQEVFMVGFDSKSTTSPRKASTHKTKTKFPHGWKEYSYTDIRSHFACRKRSRDMTKPLPTLEDWQLMRDTFTQVVDSTKQWDDPVPPTMGYSYSLEKGIPVPPPYYSKFSQGKGRGLFASRHIEKGELVHDGNVSDVLFPDAIAWRRFLFSLPGYFACDHTDWFWTQRHVEGGPYFIHTSIDISVLMNSAGKEYEFGEGDQKPNAMPESNISGRFYALRDIEKEEEILTDYDAYFTSWEEVGLN